MSALAKAVALFRPGLAQQMIGPIGVDFALESIHLVQLQGDVGGSLAVRARVSLPFDCPRNEVLSNPDKFRSLVKQALANGNFDGRKAIVAVPSGLFRTVSINYLSSGEQDDDAAILRVMRDRLDGELSDFVLDYLPVSSRSKNNERLALVAVSEREPIVKLLESARKARLDVEALEIGPVAISRLVGALSAERGSCNILVINSGRRASYLTLISGTDLLLDQQVDFSENALLQQLTETLDMPEEMVRDLVLRTGVEPGRNHDSVSRAIDESGLISTMSEILKPQFLQLVEEIKRVCLYAAAETRGGAVTQIYLLGSIARWPGSENLLGSMTNVNVAKIPDPLSSFAAVANQRGSTRSDTAPEIAVATGLALRGLPSYG